MPQSTRTIDVSKCKTKLEWAEGDLSNSKEQVKVDSAATSSHPRFVETSHGSSKQLYEKKKKKKKQKGEI